MGAVGYQRQFCRYHFPRVCLGLPFEQIRVRGYSEMREAVDSCGSAWSGMRLRHPAPCPRSLTDVCSSLPMLQIAAPSTNSPPLVGESSNSILVCALVGVFTAL